MSKPPVTGIESIDNRARVVPQDQPSPRARQLLAKMVRAADVTAALDSRYLVKGWFDRGAASVLYGEAGTGKTFAGFDIGYHVAAGRDWHGARVNGGPVLYIIAEGGKAVLNRVAALRDRDGVPLWCLPASVDFCKKAEDAEAVIQALEHIEGTPFALIVIDTLARAMGAGNENDAPDMGAMVRNVDTLREKTGAHVMLVHHCGKDQAKGARGHSSLRAAVDTEIELSKEGDVIMAEAKKQRDMPCGKPFAYKLREVELGQDSDGDPVTTCVVEPCEPCEPIKRAPTLGKVQRQVLEALREYAAERGEFNPGGMGWPEPGKVRIVSRDDFLAFVAEKMTSETPKDRRKVAKRTVDALIDKGLAAVNEGQLWPVK